MSHPTPKDTAATTVLVTAHYGKWELSKLSQHGRPETGRHLPKAGRRQCSSTQVSVQRTDANLGHQACER